MKKILFVLSLLLGLALAAPAATLPVSGSFFVSGTNGLGGTNCWNLASGGTTNLTSTNWNSINVSGAGAIGLMVNLVGVTATTQAVRAVFSTSLDGVLYTTATNGLYVDIPTSGASQVIWSTNIAATAIAPFAYMRLSILSQTNLGVVTFSNFNYRFLQTQ